MDLKPLFVTLLFVSSYLSRAVMKHFPFYVSFCVWHKNNEFAWHSFRWVLVLHNYSIVRDKGLDSSENFMRKMNMLELAKQNLISVYCDVLCCILSSGLGVSRTKLSCCCTQFRILMYRTFPLFL